MKSKPAVFVVAAIWALIVSVSTASATSLERMTLDQMAADADLAVVGTFVDSTGSYVDGTFSTTVTVAVDEVVFGPSTASVQLVYPGGSAEINGIRLGESTPALAPGMVGTRAVLFLDAGADTTTHRILGASQGQFEIIQRDDAQMVAGPDQSALMSVDAFVAQVRALRESR